MWSSTHKNPTPYPSLNEILEELVTSIKDILKDNFVGAYLQGSFAVGGFDEDSDCDFIIVINKELTDSQVSALQTMHGRIFDIDPGWPQHLEGSYFPRASLKDFREAGKELWYLDNGSRALIKADHCNTALVRWIVREKGVILEGPPPDTLVDPIPVDVLRRYIYEAIHFWGREVLENSEKYANRFYQSYITLNWCRMLFDLKNGFPGSKRDGAEWAKANLDPRWRGLIDRTWANRPRPEIGVREPADPEEYKLTLEFVRYVMDESYKYYTPSS
ncbi:DUF4111 domain-containing protein [bacterium]|nr:DUF4111 domain-containing protein [bacterium]